MIHPKIPQNFRLCSRMQKPMKKASIKITIFGAGSIGSYLGGLMVSSGAEVEMIGRESSAKSIKGEWSKANTLQK